VSFDTVSNNGDESASPYDAMVSISRADAQNTTVEYIVSGTTTNADHTLVSGTVTFLAGEVSQEISIPIIDDILKELNETVILTLSNPINGILGTNVTFIYTINDNDIASGIEFSTGESSNLESLNMVDIPISLASISGTNTTIDYTISGTATSGDDYYLDEGTATIIAGETTTNINIEIIDDILKEENETVIIALSNPTNSNLGANSIYTYTIRDDDLYPTLEFDEIQSAGDENVTTVNIPVSISSPYAEDVTFSYSASDGTATGGDVDYSLVSGTGTIIAGETSTEITIVIFDDDISEETETLLVTISNPVNATLGKNISHIYSILDNEISITSVTGNNIKATSAKIVWTTADFTDGLIEYGIIAPGNEGAYNLQKSNEDKILDHSFYLGNLTPETTYYFRTTSTNLNNETTVFESEFATTPGPVISDVLSSEITDTTVLITWTTDIPTTSQVNYGIDINLADFDRSGSDELVTTHSVLLTNLASANTYYYLVAGIDADLNETEDANNGDYYIFITGDDQTPPVLSEISVPIITSTQAAIVWLSNEPVDGKVMYGTNVGVYENETDLILTPLTNHLAITGELSETTTYFYVVESSDANGNTTTSEEHSFVTQAPGEVIVYRGGGSGIMGVAQEMYDLLLNENKIYKDRIGSIENEPVISNIEISNVTAFGATISFETDKDTIGFIDYDRNTNYSLLAADKDWSKSHSINLHGLNFGTDYFFKISAMNKSNLRSVSEEQNFKTKFFSENIDQLTKVENIEQFQKELESTIESILPSIVPPFIDKPVVSDITENSAIISFRTNVSAYPIVSFTPESSYDANKENSYNGEISDTTKKGISHKLNLVNLKPNTKYHFIVKAFSLPQVIGKSDDFTFMTKASKIQGSIIDIKKDSFIVVWNTDEPTSSIVEYKNINSGRVSRIADSTINSSHSLKIENLTPGTQYQVTISGINSKGNIIEGGSPLNIKTSTDNIPPTISGIKVDSSLVAGREDKVQTIISWQTDEPSTSAVYYEEGSGSIDSPLSSKQEDSELTKNHVVILNSLKPGTVYRFSVESMDGADNINKQPVRTIITPKKSESIIDVIFKNFDDTFNFINNVR